MDSDSSDESTHELGPESPEELNSPADSDDSDGSMESPAPLNNRSPSPVDSHHRQSPADVKSIGDSPLRSSVENSPIRSPVGDLSSPSSLHRPESSPKHCKDKSELSDDKGELSDDKGELSDSSIDSHSSDSQASSVGSKKRRDSEDLGHNEEVLNLEAGDKLLSPGVPQELDEPQPPSKIISHGADLSDVSDLESDDGSLDLSDEEPKKPTVVEKPSVIIEKKDNMMPGEEVEQLDFEAEEVQEKEEGECEGKEEKSDNEGEIVDGDDEGELKGDDLEEGEVSDDDENRPEETEPRPICRFYNRGQCTWGASCRFLHPGVTDKGNYTMFDMVRPLVPVNGSSLYPSIDYRAASFDKPPFAGGRKEEPPVFESAWERGLRQAKEMMRKSTKRKETDMDFEEKKMNLSIGQEELDKENDYYTRPASPILKDEPERWGLAEGEVKYREATATPRYDDYPDAPGAAYYPPPGRGREAGWGEYGGGRRVQYEPTRDEYHHQRGAGKFRPGGIQHRQIPDYYDEPMPRKNKKHPAREVIVQRIVEKPWRDERYVEAAPPTAHRGGRGDEWADPWMRSKSPGGGRKAGGPRPRRQSYSSGSSYSSSSTTRSASSASSYSSYSHNSRSRSRSPKSRSPKSHSRSPAVPRNARRKPPQPATRGRPPAPQGQTAVRKKIPDGRVMTKGKAAPPAAMLMSEKKAASERMLLMNPPAPSPRKVRPTVRPPSPGMMRKSAQNPPPPLASARATVPTPANDRSKAVLASALVAKAAKLQRRLRPSRSTSGSESSGSSSDSSESSYSSSSSSREPTPKAVRPAKRIVIDERERLALAQKVKAMDALKLSGQKQQIKLTLKTPGSNPPAPSKRAMAGVSLPELPELNLVRRERPTVPSLAGKKRPADGPLELDAALSGKGAAPASKKATSRREELLKQLKAVEDAIARKRSKN